MAGEDTRVAGEDARVAGEDTSHGTPANMQNPVRFCFFIYNVLRCIDVTQLIQHS